MKNHLNRFNSWIKYSTHSGLKGKISAKKKKKEANCFNLVIGIYQNFYFENRSVRSVSPSFPLGNHPKPQQQTRNRKASYNVNKM